MDSAEGGVTNVPTDTQNCRIFYHRLKDKMSSLETSNSVYAVSRSE